MSENARDYIQPSPDVLHDADTFMTMEFRIHKAVEEGKVTYDEVAELVDAFISSRVI